MNQGNDTPGIASIDAPKPVGGSFLAMAGGSAVTHVAGLVLGIVGSIIVARSLGPGGKGTLYFLMTVPAMLFTFGNLGFGSAITYRIGRKLTPAPVVATHAVGFALVLSAVAACGTLLIVPPANPIWDGVAPWIVFLALGMTPLLFLHNYLGRALAGVLRIHHRNAAVLTQSVLTLLLLMGLLLALRRGLSAALVAYVLGLAAAVLLQFAFVWRFTGFRLRFDLPMLLGSLRYGMLAWLLLLSNAMVYRIDVFFVKGWLGKEPLGFYSVAAHLAQLFWLLPDAIGTVLMPVAAHRAKERSTHALALCRTQACISLFGAPVLAVLAPLAILVYGWRFMPALWPFYALLPGVLILPIFKYLTVDLAARGIQVVPLLISLAGLAVDLVLVVLWVPAKAWYGGIVGAGLASSVAYSLMALLAAAYFVRVRDASFREIFRFGREELRLIRALPGRLLQAARAKARALAAVPPAADLSAEAPPDEPARPMRIAGLLAVTGLGGSQNSAAAFCKHLAERGHDVTLFCDAEKTIFATDLAPARVGHLPTCPILPHPRYNLRVVNLLRLISRARKGRFDAMIVFNPQSLILGEPMLALRGLPTVFFALGMCDAGYVRRFSGPAVANSLETQAWLERVIGRPAEQIPVIRARIDVAALEARSRAACPELALVPKARRLVVLMSRLDWLKMPMVAGTIEAADLLAPRVEDFALVVGGDGEAQVELERLAEQVNRRHGRTVVRLVGGVANPAAMFRRADVVLGVGRGLWEGMAFGKPSLVVGQMGFAGAVTPETVQELGYYNFAGRNVTQPVPPPRLADELGRILTDDAYARELGAFAREFILESLDARVGAAQLERVLRHAAAGGPLPLGRRLWLLGDLLGMFRAMAARDAKALIKSVLRGG